jgi:hypothetical protein
MIEGVVKEIDERNIVLMGGERALLNEKTEFLRETGFDAARVKLTDVTKGKLVYIQTKKQEKPPVAIVVVLRLIQPPEPKAVEEPKKEAKDVIKKDAGLNILNIHSKKDDDLPQLPEAIDGLLMRGRRGYGTNTVTDEGIKHLTRFKRLRILEAAGLGLTDRALETIGKLTSLEELSLEINKITGTGLRHLAGLKKLRRLNLNYNQLDPAALEALVGLPELTTLRISLTLPVDDRLCELCSRLKNLKELQLWENTAAVTDRGLEHLAKLEHLENLYLRGSPHVTDAGLAKIARLKHLRKLQLRDLRSVTPEGMKILGKLTELRSLEIDSVRMDEASVRSLTPLTKLENLLLWGVNNRETPIALDCLGELRSLRTFRTQMPVSSSAIRALARLPELESITDELFEITDEDLAHLARLPKLKTLVLASPKVTAAALPTLAKMTSLRELYMTEKVGITPEQWTRLGQDSLPQCRIGRFRPPYTLYHEPKR